MNSINFSIYVFILPTTDTDPSPPYSSIYPHLEIKIFYFLLLPILTVYNTYCDLTCEFLLILLFKVYFVENSVKIFNLFPF